VTTKQTINKGWVPVTVGSGTYITTTQEENDAPSSGAVSFVTPAIPATAKLSGSKVLVFIEVVTAGASVICDMFMEISPNGTNWSVHENSGADYIPIATNILPDTEGFKVYLVDLTTFRSPYYRIGINSAGNDLGTAMKFTMGYSYLI
tara:strand:- start:137 stop:580 length:444 start_codon:yes stop_codon:yes gene_type:complete